MWPWLLLHLRPKRNYRTRQNLIDFFDTGVNDIYGSAGFVHTTARLWNKAPLTVKEATFINIVKIEIRKFVMDEIPM